MVYRHGSDKRPSTGRSRWRAGRGGGPVAVAAPGPKVPGPKVPGPKGPGPKGGRGTGVGGPAGKGLIRRRTSP
ncbi:hypothetical protein [Streptomyces sp. A0958]|uniref:hypothetical protein n=1 Tax=Streptomyces sp. A0958 TaxID=2563101 RepID=UPI001444C531|nr:hypothetical protein [Streptomyces sp. A0958]